MNWKTILAIALIVFAFLLSVYYYPQLPEKIASHWNAAGEADGFSSKTIALFLVPGIMLVLFLLFKVIPVIDPLKKNIAEFRHLYDNFIVLFLGFMLYLHLLSIAWNLQVSFNFMQALSPAFAALFFYAGTLIQHAKQNWSIGIRTPWTLSNETVWKKTHILGSKLFKASGIVCLVGVVYPPWAIWFVLVPILASAVITVVFSYLEFQRQTKK